MTPQERADWLIAQAEEIEEREPPLPDPHEHTGSQSIAAALRDIAARVLAAHGLGPWPSENHYWDPLA